MFLDGKFAALRDQKLCICCARTAAGLSNVGWSTSFLQCGYYLHEDIYQISVRSLYLNVSSSGPGKQPDVFKYTILEASSWRPFRPLDFGPPALRVLTEHCSLSSAQWAVLRSCDPTHVKLSPEWPYTSMKIYFHNISTFKGKQKRHQSTAYIFIHIHSSFDIHCLISIVGQDKIKRKNTWYSKYLPSLTHAQSWVNVESIQSLRLTRSQLRHRKRELQAEAMMIPERKTFFKFVKIWFSCSLINSFALQTPPSQGDVSHPLKRWNLTLGHF